MKQYQIYFFPCFGYEMYDAESPKTDLKTREHILHAIIEAKNWEDAKLQFYQMFTK